MPPRRKARGSSSAPVVTETSSQEPWFMPVERGKPRERRATLYDREASLGRRERSERMTGDERRGASLSRSGPSSPAQDLDRVPLRRDQEVRRRPGGEPRRAGRLIRVVLPVPLAPRPGDGPRAGAPGQHRPPADGERLGPRELPCARNPDLEERSFADRQRGGARDRDRADALGRPRRPQGDA